MRKIILVLIAFLSVASLFAEETNILIPFNGGFENGMTSWRFFEVPNDIGSTAEITTTDVIEGLQAVKVNFVTDDGSVVDRGFDNWDANVPVIGGADYTAKVMAKADSSSGLYLQFVFGYFDKNGSIVGSQTEQIHLSDIYQEFTITSTAPGTAATCWIGFRLTDENAQRIAGTFYLDDARILGESTTLIPSVMPTTLSSDDVPIASINVTDAPFNAVNDGSVDATSAFQDAIDRAVVAGGGVVFIPAGRYRFDGNLLVREKVILRGEWQNPEENSNVVGTILMPYAGQGSESGEAFISLEIGSGVKNLSVWYPNQSASAVSPYPFTILCNPETAKGAGDNTSVINVTLVNSYQGIKIGPVWNELHYIRNVYGTPLKTGIWLSQTTDIGRIMNVHFEPKFWSTSGLTGSPSESTILNWLQSNGTGIIMGRSDWEYIYDVSLVGYQTGMQIIRYSDFGPNGVIYGLNIDKSKIGIDLSDVNFIGWAITNSTINVEGENSSCVITGDAFTTIVQFNSCTFGGNPKTAVQFSENSTGRLSFQNCTFENWGHISTDAAIDCETGSVSLIGNTFTEDKLHFRFGASVENSQILDNIFPTELKVENNSEGEIIISQEPLGSAKLEVPPHPFAAELRPPNDDLFIVQDYGAIADGLTDNTIAFQAALDAASGNGGGTVYIPAGWYRFNGHIMVPTGVELRGIWDVPHHTTSQGSVLLVYEGKNNPSGTPFVSMGSGSGVRGFTIWYPEQNTDDFPEYPWSIQTQGDNCWIKDVTLGNTWQGVDLASYPSSGHVISYLAGSPLKSGLSVSQNLSEGWVENVQFNPHYWLRSSGYPKVSEPGFDPLVSQQQGNLNAFNIGSTNKEHFLGTFVFASNRGLNLIDDGGTSNVDIFLHGSDAASNGIFIESKEGSKINFINSQLVLLGNSQNGIITTGSGFSADVSFFNSLSWGEQNGFTVDISGSGKLLVQQLHMQNGAFNINGGSTRLENIKISTTLNPQYIIGENAIDVKIFDSYAENGFKLSGENNSNVEFDYNYKQSTIGGIGLETGWEIDDTQNYWNNTLWGNKNIDSNDTTSYQCKAVETGESHSGSRALTITGNKISGTDSLFYKIFKYEIPVFDSTMISYWLNPKDESGRSVFIDLVFSDGSRLSELSPIAEDGLPLSSARGNIGEWVNIICNVGTYATGKNLQTVIVGTSSLLSDNFNSLIDDLNISTTFPLPEPWQHVNIGEQILDGYSIFRGETLSIHSASLGFSNSGDQLSFVYQPMDGECEISTRLENISNPGFSPNVGIMIRENVSTKSKFVSLMYTPYLGLNSKQRESDSSNIKSTFHLGVEKVLPKWLKVSRKGDEFKTYTSDDGIDWGIPLHIFTMDMESSVIIGLVATTGIATTWMETEYSNIIVSDKVVSTENILANVPKTFQLFQNHPNPFNPSTTIQYDLSNSGEVSLSVYDVLGRQITTLVNERQSAGSYNINWDAGNLSSGIYFYRLNVTSSELKKEVVFSKKMILLK